MDKCSSDADFDSYWEYESRNKNRNRIRVGRQYQASVPPLLKPGEKDTRRCEDLETLKWKPDKLSDQCVDQYLSMAKAISRFARAIDPSLVPEKAVDTPMQTALKGLSEFVTSHHPCHHDAGCQVPRPQLSGECSTKLSSSNEWTPNEAQLFAQALEVCGKNFCAIKKDFLPWKPVRSLIEYYYQGKSEKTECINPTDPESEDLHNKVEKLEPVASCDEDLQEIFIQQVVQPKAETKELPEDHSRDFKIEAPEESVCVQSVKSEENNIKCEEMKPADSSTVGSLKFYLGGRLVLKLNAQQYNDSENKCHWVPSSDTPKRPQLIKRVKHRKKIYQESSSAGYQLCPSNTNNLSWESSDFADCDVVLAKKAKLKSDCESSSEPEISHPLLYSTSWTPPVANGPDVEMDDGSSKTSEGCLSPMQVNSLGETSETKCEVSAVAVNSSAMCGNFCDPSETDGVRSQHECPQVKVEGFPDCCGTSQSETFVNDSNTIQGTHLKTEKSLPNQLMDSTCSQELQSSQLCTKNVCNVDMNNTMSFLPRSAVSCSPSKKQWYRWVSSPCADGFESTKVHSPNSISQTSVLGQTVDSPLDLSSRGENSLEENIVQDTVPGSSISADLQKDKSCQSPSKEIHLSHSKSSDDSLNVSLSSSDSVTVDKDTKVRYVLKTEDNKISVSESECGENGDKCTENEINIHRLSVKNVDEKNKNSSDFSYPFYNLPCSCSSPKCANNFALKEHMCNKDGIECLKSHSNYLLPVADRTASDKPPPWYEASVATYLQYYPQCYPYYFAYGVAPSSCTGSSVGELPLDLSSTCENSKEENVQHNVPEKETSVTPNSAEALQKGMLYHLLKNRNSK